MDKLRAQVVVAQHFAVVSREDNPGIFQQLQFMQPGKEAAKSGVDLGNQGVMAAANFVNLLAAKAGEIAQCLGGLQEAWFHLLRIG